MNKVLILIGVAVILVVGYVLLTGNTEEQPASSDATPTENVDNSPATTETEEISDAGDMEPVTDAETAPVADATERVFTLDSFSYGYSETELRVNQGDTVTINLTNSGGFHDWVVDEFGAATEKISAGDTTSVTFVADQAGTFEYYCSVGNHRAQGMVGTLIVE
jgi:plastocyanin